MPASPRSLQLVEAYRRRLLTLGDRVEVTARDLWPRIEDDLEAWPTQMAPVVARAQRDGVRLTAAFLAAYLRLESGRGTVPDLDSARYVGKSRDGRPLDESLRSPIIGVLTALKAGKSPDEALNLGLVRARRSVTFEAMQTPREALLDAIKEHPRTEGFQRQVAGTCGACMALSGEENMDVHPGCQCLPVPKVQADEFGKGVKKGERVEARSALEHKNGKEVPVENIRGKIIKANDSNVMLEVGAGARTRYFTASRSSLQAIERAQSKSAVLRAELGQSPELFSTLERDALRAYTGGNKGEFGAKGLAEGMNTTLRRGSSAEKWADFVDRLDSAFTKVKGLSSEGTVFRGTKVAGARGLAVGDVIEDAGFMSTSVARTQAEEFVAYSKGDLFEITLPKGSRAIDMNRASGSAYGKERELLLPRGTRMVIDSIEPNPARRGSRIIHATVVL